MQMDASIGVLNTKIYLTILHLQTVSRQECSYRRNGVTDNINQLTNCKLKIITRKVGTKVRISLMYNTPGNKPDMT